MAYVLEESQTNYNGGAAPGSASYRLGQTFKAGSSYTLTKVELLMYREGTPPNITVEIQGTSGGAPDNNVLATQSIDISSITTSTSGEWVEIIFDTPAELTLNTTYAIVVGDGYTDSSNRYRWNQNTVSDDYTDGSKYFATTGENWSQSNYDFCFKTYSGSDIIDMEGSFAGISNAVGSLNIINGLAGSISGISNIEGALNAKYLRGVIAGISSVLGSLDRNPNLIGSIAAASDVLDSLLKITPDFETSVLIWKPQSNIIETLEWKTEILKAYDGSEQRIKVRQSPRQHFRIRVAFPTDVLCTQYDALIHSWQKRKWFVPVWPEQVLHTGDINADASVINVDTTFADFRNNSKAIIWKSESEYEVIAINTKTDSQLNLAYDVLNSFTGDKYIVPVRTAYISSASKKTKHNSQYSFVDFIFAVYDNINLEGYVPSLNYDGYPVLDVPAFMGNTHPESSDGDIIITDFQTGIFKVESNTEFNIVTQGHNFFNDTKEACWNFRRFLHSLNGRQKVVLIPTFRADVTQIENIGATDTSIKIANIGLAENMGLNSLRTYLGFYFPNGTLIVRKITGIAGPSESEPTKETITIDAGLSWPTTITPGDCKIGFVDKCRLVSDRIQIIWPYAHRNECRTNFVRVQ